MIQNSKFKIQNSRRAFSLIELLVAMFIFMVVMGGMVAVSVAGFRSYQKSRAIKRVLEEVGFAINSIAKDVRMGKIESADNTGRTPSASLVIKRNRDQVVVCYKITSSTLGVCDSACGNCKSTVDFSGTDMAFNMATSGFFNQKTDTLSNSKTRGWAEINLNIENPTMETDSIRVQTIVSSRDYGWEEKP